MNIYTQWLLMVLVLTASACTNCTKNPSSIPSPLTSSSLPPAPIPKPATTSPSTVVVQPTIATDPELPLQDCLKSLPDVETDKSISSKESEIEADELAAKGKAQEALEWYSHAHLRYYGELGRAAARTLMGRVPEPPNKSVQSPEFLFKVGRTFAQTGNHGLAISCLSESLNKGIKQPNDASAYINRGDAYLKLGYKVKAKEDFQKSAELFQQYKLPQYQKLASDRLKKIL